MTSVASQNPFAALAEEPEVSVKEREIPAKEPVVAPKKVDKSRAQPKEARIRFEYPQRGGHKAPASNRSEDTRSAAPRDRNVGPRLSGRREEGGGSGGGDYPTRNSRGARPNDRGRGNRGSKRGREHDRHSGTGKHDSEKKENQAWGNATNSWENEDTAESKGWSGNKNKKSDSTWENTNNNNSDSWGGNNTTEDNSNWGTTGTTGTTEDKSGAADNWNVTTAEEPTENNNWQDPQPTDSSDIWASGDMENKSETKKEDTAAGNSAPAPEPEEVVKTYDEYLAEKAQKSLDISLPEFRKPNEGADDSQWKHAVPLEKDEDDEYFTGKEQSYRNKSKKSKTKNYLEITQTFDRPGGGSSRGRGRGRGGRGGRGRDDREGRDGRDGRDGRIYDDNNRDNRRRGGSGRGVNLDDQRAFPSLGASS